MSDLGIIVPIAIVVLVALALGSSSGVADPDEWETYTADMARIEDFGSPVEWGSPPPQTIRQSQSDFRFDRDQETWQLQPNGGEAMLELSKRMLDEQVGLMSNLREVREKLDEQQEQDEESMQIATELEDRLESYQSEYVDREGRNILVHYRGQIDDIEHAITGSLDSDDNFLFFGENMTKERRRDLIQHFRSLSRSMSEYLHEETQQLHYVRESLKIHSSLEPPSMFDGRVPDEERGGYVGSVTNSQFQQPSGTPDRHDFDQGPRVRLNKPPASAPNDPEVSQLGGFGPFEVPRFTGNPINLSTRLQGDMRDARTQAMNQPAPPATPPRRIPSAHKGSPDFRSLQIKVKSVRDRVSPFPLQHEETFSTTSEAMSDENVSYVQGQAFGNDVVKYISSPAGPDGQGSDRLEKLMTAMKERQIETLDLDRILETSKDASQSERSKLLRETTLVTPKIKKRVLNFVSRDVKSRTVQPVRRVVPESLWKVSANALDVYRRNLERIQSELDIAEANQDRRGMMGLRTRIEQSAPPGTDKGCLYEARRDRSFLRSGRRKIDFSVVEKDEVYQQWNRVLTNIENAML